jgi:WD repeat-containing protein 23
MSVRIKSSSGHHIVFCRDRRSLGSHANPTGVLVGHTEGVAYVSPKGDGRYVVSNGKDQTMRLWDLRKMRSYSEWEAMPKRSYGLSPNWDYRSVCRPSLLGRRATFGYHLRLYVHRNGRYRTPRYDAHPKNCSVMAYRGHHVLRTLIRCHFSPQETTGASYLYSGSSDGRIHVCSRLHPLLGAAIT